MAAGRGPLSAAAEETGCGRFLPTGVQSPRAPAQAGEIGYREMGSVQTRPLPPVGCSSPPPALVAAAPPSDPGLQLWAYPLAALGTARLAVPEARSQPTSDDSSGNPSGTQPRRRTRTCWTGKGVLRRTLQVRLQNRRFRQSFHVSRLTL